MPGVAPRDLTATRAAPRRPWLLPAAVTLGACAYVYAYLDRGWVPHDEGTLAHAAERVLQGELPHRDFGEVYTGGLSYLHALALEALGMNLLSLRFVLLLATAAWIPVVYWIARRFVSRAAAALVVLLAVAWSVPNYAAAVPSWYTMMLATMGAAALLRWGATEQPRWLVAAGVLAGASVAVKIVGVYFAAAAGLFLLFREQDAALEPGARRGRTASVILTAALVALPAGAYVLTGQASDPAAPFHLVLPPAALSGLLIWREWSVPRAELRVRVRRLFGPAAWFAAGAALPLVVLLAPFLVAGAAGDLVRGVLVAPAARFETASMRLPPPATLVLPVALVTAVFLGEPRLGAAARRWAAVGAALLLGVALIFGGRLPVYATVWQAIRGLVPVAVAGGAVFLAGRRGTGSRAQDEGLFALLAVTGWVSLIQFPFGAPVYFVYVAPLAVLAVAALAAGSRQPRPTLAVGAAFLLLFGALWVNRGFIYHMGHYYVRDNQTERLALPRGGLRVSAEEKAEYEALATQLVPRALGGYTFVTPDSPEVYFLTGLRNATPIVFDFLDQPAGRVERVLAALERHDVRAIAVNTTPGFTVYGGRIDGARFSPPEQRLLDSLVARFPHRAPAGGFVVRWRE
jgi:hypothetical protein